jgi:hypothetical protein
LTREPRSDQHADVRRRSGEPSRLAAKREQFFECVFAADRSEYRFHLRAWTPEEAAQHLVSELGEYGVEVAGEVRVVDPRGKVLVNVEYAPPRRVQRERAERA